MAEETDLESFIATFQGIGLADKNAQDIAKNPKLRQAVMGVIKEAGVEAGAPKAQGALLYTVASKFPDNALVHRPKLLAYITGDQIRGNHQLDGALEFLAKLGPGALDAVALEEAAGVGATVSEEDLRAAVSAVVAANEARLREQRYHCNLNILLGQVRTALKWADVGLARAEVEAQVAALLGPKTEADLQPPEKKKKEKAPPPPAANGANGGGKEAAAAAAKAAAEKKAAEAEAWRTADPYAFLPKPEDNNGVHTVVNFSDGRVMRMSNSPQALADHLARTGGKVITRFPPEPNGYLHIGHAKAMFVDFGMAAQYGGHCYLRFDDTNPEAEKQEYIDHIQEIVGWLGWKPWKVTYSSDYFDQLYEFAIALIKGGNAYVCHQRAEEIKESREKREPSPWRDRPAAESLALFEDMRRGLVDEGGATLRMRMDHRNDNFNMFDLIAYRIKFVAHPHAGDRWCVYPSYDYTHCLVDALEDITHSMCTLEFESRRASYFWLLEVLGTYQPVVWEYSRLNVSHNVLSKRKLNRLVTDKLVAGWDDPRLLTLSGLRRRGVTPSAVNSFCRELGLTRSEGEVHLHKLEHHIRADLDATSRRQLAVLRPLRLVITSLPEGHLETVEAKDFPGRGDAGYAVPFTRVVYIEATDFREEDARDYYGLAPGKAVMLRYAYPVTATGFTRGPDGRVAEVQAVHDPDYRTKKPPKGVLNWVGQPAPGQAPPSFEARLYDVLFTSQSPGGVEDWLQDLNPASVEVVRGAFANPVLVRAAVGERFQLERLGYFCVDPDSRPGALVLARTVTLKESVAKVAAVGRK